LLVKELFHAHQEENWSTYLGSITPSQAGYSKLYTLNRQLLGIKRAEHPLTDSEGQLHFDDADKTEIFANAMEEQFKTPTTATPNSIDELVQTILLGHEKKQYDKTIFFIPTEIWNKIRKLPSKKPPGPDGVTNSALKHSGKKTIIQLTHIYNGCIRAEYSANIRIVLDTPPEYPKVFEFLLLDRLKLWTTTRPEQHGFRAHHTITT